MNMKMIAGLDFPKIWVSCNDELAITKHILKWNKKHYLSVDHINIQSIFMLEYPLKWLKFYEPIAKVIKCKPSNCGVMTTEFINPYFDSTDFQQANADSCFFQVKNIKSNHNSVIVNLSSPRFAFHLFFNYDNFCVECILIPFELLTFNLLLNSIESLQSDIFFEFIIFIFNRACTTKFSDHSLEYKCDAYRLQPIRNVNVERVCVRHMVMHTRLRLKTAGCVCERA